MWSSQAERTLSELEEIGRQTAATFADQEKSYSLWQQSRIVLTDIVQKFLDRVHTLPVDGFTEDHFVAVDNLIAANIAAMENHLAINVDSSDAAQLHFFGEAIRTLRDARSWIVQGLSPDPAKRPSEKERARLADECARRALKHLNDA